MYLCIYSGARCAPMFFGENKILRVGTIQNEQKAKVLNETMISEFFTATVYRMKVSRTVTVLGNGQSSLCAPGMPRSDRW